MKKILLTILIIFLFQNSILAEADTEGYYSPTISFTVDAKTQIRSVKQTLISTDTNRLTINLLAAINGDSLGIYVDNDFIDTITIQDTVLIIYYDIDILNYDNSELKLYIYYETGNYLAYSITIIDNKGFYSPTISFIVDYNSFILGLENIKSDYLRYKKITELYPELNNYYYGSFEYNNRLSLLEGDNYYREPHLPYFKFKRLNDKYK